MTRDESRAVTFLGILLLLAIVARAINRPAPISIQAAPVDIQALRDAGESLKQNAPRRPAVSAGRQTGTGRPATPTYIGNPQPLDLNRATAADLDALPGIGPAVAARIIARRDSIGRYRSVEELDSVKGIGPALLAKIRPLVAIR